MRKDNRGFTLVELVVSVALLAIILVPTVGMFTNSFKVQNKSALKTSITRVGQHIIENFKNKDYLGFSVGETSIDDYIRDRTESDTPLTVGTELLEGEDGNYLYKNENYNIEMKVKNVEVSALKNADMPDVSDNNNNYSGFDCAMTISEGGGFIIDKYNSNVEYYEIGSNFEDPINHITYTADYPTIIIKGNLNDDFEATLDKILIKNNYHIRVNETTLRQGIIRIVKNPIRELKVYIKGENLSIKKGKEGDGATSAQTKITTYYVEDGTNENSSDEILLDVEMTIYNANDKDIRDTFNFSFSVDKED